MNLPKQELMEAAERAILAAGGPTKAYVHFKYTCANCGERCTLTEPNTLHEFGECHACGHKTLITEGGFLLGLKLK
jgi:DNA-directed RNA polymerase subunit RPC12/RpoP